MHDTGSLIIAVVGSIVLAAILGLIAQRIKISPLVGYLIAGIVFGQLPQAYQADGEIISQLAEIGIILLMFGVGLHFSLIDLIQVKNIAIPGAIVQIIVATLLGMGLSSFMGWSTITGIIFGLCLSTASTVVLLRALEEKKLIDSQRGKIAIGWLIVEDLVMVLVLVLLPAVVNALGKENINLFEISIQIAKTVGLVIIFIIMMMIIGRKTIPWLLAKSASTGSNELFTLTVLAIALGIAFIAVQLFGASFALGAFFAGVVLNGSEFSHRAAHDTLPLRDAFSVLFFVSVGMLFKPEIILSHPIALLSTVIIIVFGKSIAAYFIVRLFGHSKRTALTISASLAQIGEFAFILAALGVTLDSQLNMTIFPSQAHSLILAGSIISIVLNPLIFSLVEGYLAKTETLVDMIIDGSSSVSQPIPENICQHAILIGHGKIGSIISNQLQHQSIPSIIIDSSLSVVDDLRAHHHIALFGDANEQKILELAKIDCARWLIISMPNSYKAGEIVALARKIRPDLAIYVRAFYDDGAEYIAERGATEVITGEREIADRILGFLNLPPSSDDDNDNDHHKSKQSLDISEFSELPEGNGSPF